MFPQSITSRFWSKVDKRNSDECWEWTGARASNGYGNFAIHSGDFEKVHRMSWMIEHGPIPDGLCVCHECDNRACVNPDHLWLGTIRDNNQDAVNKGRTRVVFGSDNQKAKLNETDVRRIRQLLSEGYTHRKIAAEYGVTHPLIGQISRGKIWRSVK